MPVEKRPRASCSPPSSELAFAIVKDHVIDLRTYLKGKKEDRRGTFSIWGGEGERSRFALPMWRAIYLARGDWGALLWGRDEHVPRKLTPFFVLDLKSEPARTDVDAELVDGLWTGEAPQLLEDPSGPVLVLLGQRDGRRWFLAIAGADREARLEPHIRDDLLFLAGECAGLLFHRDLAGNADAPEG